MVNNTYYLKAIGSWGEQYYIYNHSFTTYPVANDIINGISIASSFAHQRHTKDTIVQIIPPTVYDKLILGGKISKEDFIELTPLQ